jgi:hypothetical protein
MEGAEVRPDSRGEMPLRRACGVHPEPEKKSVTVGGWANIKKEKAGQHKEMSNFSRWRETTCPCANQHFMPRGHTGQNLHSFVFKRCGSRFESTKGSNSRLESPKRGGSRLAFPKRGGLPLASKNCSHRASPPGLAAAPKRGCEEGSCPCVQTAPSYSTRIP